MIGTIRKHQTWLWVFIIAAVIVSFVVYFTPGVTTDRSGGGQGQFGSIHGRAIARKDMLQAATEARLGQYLRTGQWPDSGRSRNTGFDVDRQARERLVLVDRMRAAGITVDDASVAKWVEENLGRPGQPGSARDTFDSLLRGLKQFGVTEDDVVRYIKHEIGTMHLYALAGVAGQLVTPRQAAAEYRRQNERLEASAVLFSASNFLATVHLDPVALGQFYTNRQSFYRTQERVAVDYVKFDFTNFHAQAEAELAKMTNLAAALDQYYLQSGPNRFMDTNGQVLPPDAAKTRIREQMREERARVAARREAANFGTELLKLQPAHATNLAFLAASKGMPVATTTPFTLMEGPAGLDASRTLAENAFKLTPQQPISPGVVGEDGVYILALRERIPSVVPSLDEVRVRVIADFKQDEARRLARQAGTNFMAQLSNGLAAGKSFAEVSAAANVETVSLPRFSAASRNLPDWDRRINFDQARRVAESLAPGTTSSLLPSSDGAYVLFLKSREPVTDGELKDALPNFVKEMRDENQYAAFGEWFTHQIEATRITMPQESANDFGP